MNFIRPLILTKNRYLHKIFPEFGRGGQSLKRTQIDDLTSRLSPDKK
jgi:hypothetical protein